MNISVIVYLPAQSLLASRHLLHSLVKQSSALEVILVHDKNIALPNWLPASWQYLAMETTNPGQAWNEGLLKVSGDYVCFTTPDVYYHDRHFEVSQKYLSQSQPEAIYHRCHFVTPQLNELHEVPFPQLAQKDWIGHMLIENLSIPIGAMLFHRNQLSDAPFNPEICFYTEELFLSDWLTYNPLEYVDIPTVFSLLSRSRQVTSEQQTSEFIALFEQWQVIYALPDLVPTYAKHPAQPDDIKTLHHFLLQVLYNRGLQQLVQWYIEEHKVELFPPGKTVLWLKSSQDTHQPSLSALWQELLEHQYFPIILCLENKPHPHKPPFCIQYNQYQGVPSVTVFNAIPVQSKVSDDLFNPQMLTLVSEVLRQYSPDLIHMTTLKTFSLQVAQLIAEFNLPMVYSYLDHHLLCPRGDLLKYGQEPCQGPLASGANCLGCHAQPNINPLEYQSRTRQAHAVLREYASVIAIHEEHDRPFLLANGVPAKNMYRLQSLQDLLHIYQAAGQTHARRQLGQKSNLFHQLPAELSLAECHKPFVKIFKACQQVADIGCGTGGFLKLLHQENIPAVGFEQDPLLRSRAQQAGITAISDSLALFLRQFDGMHAAHQIEQMYPQQLLTFIEYSALSMRMGGTLLLRTAVLAQGHSETQNLEFWLSEKHIRPYPQALLTLLLTHAGFKIEAQDVEKTPWQDEYVQASLIMDVFPLATVPISTPAFTEYWERYTLESVPPDKNTNVLLMGPHIIPSWQILRLDCPRIQGITLDLNEVKAVKPTSEHLFRYTSDIVKTLEQLQGGPFDTIILQGLLETLSPEQVRSLLDHCRNQMTETGILVIQSMGLNENQQLPHLFWENLYNLRPYLNLESILAQTGFTMDNYGLEDTISTYVCSRAERSDVSSYALELNEFGQLFWDRATNPYKAATWTELKNLPDASVSLLHLSHGLEKTLPAELPLLMAEVWRVLQVDGELLVTCLKTTPTFWAHPDFYRPYPESLLDKWFQDHGLHRISLWEQEGGFIWYGKKCFAYNQSPLLPTSQILWQGDVFHYHSLSLVNRELLSRLVKEIDYDVSIYTYNDDSYQPPADSPLQILTPHTHRPMLTWPDFVIRHHWPPDFNAPEAGHWIMIQPWEFGSLPERWIYNMNKFLDEIWVPSHFIKESYEKSGVLANKVVVIPNGVDTQVYHPEVKPMKLATHKTYKFLFVGGSILRKGVDLLLMAYTEVFRATDDVCLVVKEFGGGKVYNNLQIPDWLVAYREKNPDMPEILHLTEDIPIADMASLYTACDSLVHPYRGEGFGLPIAEAMACERPVIVTGYGACLDFCHAENAWLIPATLKYFDEKKVDDLLTVDFPHWAIPDYEALKSLLLQAYECRDEGMAKGKAARQTIVNQFTWEQAVAKMCERLADLKEKPIFRVNRERHLSKIIGQSIQQVYEGHSAEAIAGFREALQIDPYQPSISYNLGLAYLNSGDYEQALTYLSKSLKEGDCTSDLCYALGVTLEKLGDWNTANHFYQKMQELDPTLVR